MPFGIIDTQYIDFPDGVDVAYIQGLQSRSGMSFEDLLQEIDERLGAFNTFVDPLVAELVYPTTDVKATNDRPDALMPTERSEYALERPAQVLPVRGHMLPIRGIGKALGFTEDGLRKISLANAVRNVEAVLSGFKLKHRRDVLTRLFSAAEVPVDDEITATSPGFAGSGTGSNVFQGAYPNGRPLEDNFTAYFYANTTGTTLQAVAAVEAMMDAAIARWKKVKGEAAVPDVLVSGAFAATLLKSTKYMATASALIRLSNNDREALVDPTKYSGVYDGKARIRHAFDDFSTAHAAIIEASDPVSPNNILRWRYDEIVGRNAFVRYRNQFPLAQSEIIQDYGIGVGDRLGAILMFAGNGAVAYSGPAFA